MTEPTERQRLAVVRQALASALADVGAYPCPLDEMTAREAQIAGMLATLVGAVEHVMGVIDEPDVATPPPAPPPFERERATYRAMLHHLLHTLDAEGQYVVIQGDTCHGVGRTYEDALGIGYSTCGLAPFMVKRILATEPVFVMRPG